VEKDHLTLQDLSAATGMTARNVRAYQTKGLIPPPLRQGRRSVYGPEHLHRLQAIERARARGASLSLIASHLADGRLLDGETLIGWSPTAPPGPDGSRPDGTAPGARPANAGLARASRTEIGTLLDRADHGRDPAAHAQVDELIAAGVFQQEGRRVYTGRDLAAALTALQRLGLPLGVALGVAQRAMTAAVPIADTVQQSVAELEPVPASVTGHLGDVAGCVVRHVVAVRTAS